MPRIYTPPTKKRDHFGRPMISSKSLDEFKYLLGKKLSDIILFENGTEDLLLSGVTILPRHYTIFVGTKDGAAQLKPYEYNSYRIVVSTYQDIIVSIDSIG